MDNEIDSMYDIEEPTFHSEDGKATKKNKKTKGGRDDHLEVAQEG
jgi:hypothetical protein